MKSRASQSVAEPDQYLVTVCSSSAASLFGFRIPVRSVEQASASVFKAQAATFTRYSSLPRLALAPLLDCGGPAYLAARPLFPIGRTCCNAQHASHSMPSNSSPSALRKRAVSRISRISDSCMTPAS